MKKKLIILGISLFVLILSVTFLVYFLFADNYKAAKTAKVVDVNAINEGLYYDAVKSKDKIKCESIPDENLKKACIDAIDGYDEYVASWGVLWDEYGKIQNQFALDLPCGVTDFDSPYVKPYKCDEEKLKTGEPLYLSFVGSVSDDKGVKLSDVKLSVNGGEPFYSDANGHFEGLIAVDSVKKSINVVGDKFGYSPIRKVLNAQIPDANLMQIVVPGEFAVDLKMREIEVVSVNLELDNPLLIESKKYPGLSVSVPAGGLEDSNGEIVTGEISGEITYLEPLKAEDSYYTPGFEGNAKQMVGVDVQGNSVMIRSGGLVMLHFKKAGSDELLQPRKGTVLTFTQPIPEEEYKNITSPEAIEAAQVSKEQSAKQIRDMGIKEGMTEDEKFMKKIEHNQFGISYWHFNQRTGLWEAWPVKGFDIDLTKKSYIMTVPRLY